MTEDDREQPAPGSQGDPQSRAQSDPPRTRIEILPALDAALRQAGVDPRNPDVTKTVNISLSMMMASGQLPLPPPELLRQYEDVYPGLTGKIIEWTEEQRRHRMALENRATIGSEARMNRSQFIAGSVALVGLCLAAGTAIFGNAWAAGVIAIVSVGGPTAAVYLARGDIAPRLSTPPRQDKAPSLEGETAKAR